MRDFKKGDIVELLEDNMGIKAGATGYVIHNSYSSDKLVDIYWDRNNPNYSKDYIDGKYFKTRFKLVLKKDSIEVGQTYIVTEDVVIPSCRSLILRKNDTLTINDIDDDYFYIDGLPIFLKSASPEIKNEEGYVRWVIIDFKEKVKGGLFVLHSDYLIDHKEPRSNHGFSICQFGCGCDTERKELLTSFTNICPKCKK